MPSRGQQRVRLRAARYAGTGRGDHRGRASDNGPRPPARHGQNDPAIAVGRNNWTFAGSDRGGERAAAIYTLIETAKLNGLDPEAYLADVIDRMAKAHPNSRLADLLPRYWKPATAIAQAA